MSTGHLHLIGANPSFPQIKNADTHLGICIFWQRMRDSNPRKRSQSPVCYRYTNPLYCLTPLSTGVIILTLAKKSSSFFAFLKKFSGQEYHARKILFYSSSQGKGFPFSTLSLMYRKVSFSPLSRSMVRMYSISRRVFGCISSRSRLFMK